MFNITGNLMFLKLAYLPSKVRFLSKYLLLERQVSARQPPADSSSTETLDCSIVQFRVQFGINLRE